MYANVKDAYKSTPLPPLGKSDHNLVFLQPKYTPKVRRQPTTTRSFRNWSPEAEDALRDCFESTDWSVLQDSFGEDIDGVTHCTTDYLNLCMDIVAPTKTVLVNLSAKQVPAHDGRERLMSYLPTQTIVTSERHVQ